MLILKELDSCMDYKVTNKLAEDVVHNDNRLSVTQYPGSIQETLNGNCCIYVSNFTGIVFLFLTGVFVLSFPFLR